MLWTLALLGCASAPEPVRLRDWMRVGVDPEAEAAEVEAGLAAAGWARTQRVAGSGYVALGFTRGEERAIRVVTARGVTAALDSHEGDGVRVRHGAVRLDEREPDVDGDGSPEVVIARDAEDGPCLAVLRIGEAGQVTLAPDDAEALQPGSCVGALRDVDGDGVVEALARLRWPEVAVGAEVAEVEAALVLEEGAWRSRGAPTGYAEAERERRAEALARARAARDLPRALRLAVELAALAHLDGATVSAQVERFDASLDGLVLTEEVSVAVDAARALIASGWGARPDPAMSRSSADEQANEGAGRAAGLSQPEGDQDP